MAPSGLYARLCHAFSSYNIFHYTVIHNYGNPYETWNIFVAWPHLWLKLGMVKPEIMLCEMMLNLSMLHYVTLPHNIW